MTNVCEYLVLWAAGHRTERRVAASAWGAPWRRSEGAHGGAPRGAAFLHTSPRHPLTPHSRAQHRATQTAIARYVRTQPKRQLPEYNLWADDLNRELRGQDSKIPNTIKL